MRKWTAAIFMLLVSVTLSSCSAADRNNRTDMTLSSSSFVSTTPTQTTVQTPNSIQTPNSTSTPVPTYAPGTELYGMLSVTGEIVVAPKYEYLDLFSAEGLARFEDHGLWGFVNEKGEEVIPAQYDNANNFSDGLAVVKVGGMYGFIDATGKMVIAPQFLDVGDGFHFGRCVFLENGKQGLIDKNGGILLDPQYKSIDLKCEKYSIVENSKKEFGIIDRDGIEIVKCQYPKIYSVVDSGYYFAPSSDSEGIDYMFNLEGNIKFKLPKIYTNSDYPIY